MREDDTGKELDPDFLAFNSQNARHHFPARFYLRNRGVFGQADPLLIRSGVFSGAAPTQRSLSDGPYLYVLSMPTIGVDPIGLVIVVADEWTQNGIQVGGVTTGLSDIRENSEKCPCGTATLRAGLDADEGRDIDIVNKAYVPAAAKRNGIAVYYHWEPLGLPAGPCKKGGCCVNVGWKSFFPNGAADLGKPLIDSDAEGFMITANPTGNPAIDYPHATDAAGKPYMTDHANKINAFAICRDPGPMLGKAIYKVSWHYSATVKLGSNYKVTTTLHYMKGECL